MKTISWAVLLTTALILAGCSQNRANPRNENGTNQSTGGMNEMSDENKNANLTPQDKEFAQTAATGGQAEIALGQLAAQKASDPKVKEFGQRMVTDHGQAGQQLEQIAGNKNIDLPKMLPTGAQEEQDKLSKLSGARFDKEYMRFAVEDHTKDAQEFQEVASSLSDNELKQFAQQTLPVIQQHLQMAKQIESSLK